MIIPSKNIKYIKLCIISAQYEIIVNLIYILSFFLFVFQFVSQGKYFSNYELRRMISNDFEESTFLNISNQSDFLSYLDFLVFQLYQYDPSNHGNKIPIYNPLVNIRLKKYSNNGSKCKSIISKYTTQKYIKTDDTIRTLYDIYADSDSFCGYTYDGGYNSDFYNSKYRKLEKKFMGKYSSYYLYSKGQNLDFNIDGYTQNLTSIHDFIINDKDIKFIAIIFNLYFPQNDNYATILAVIEMVN